MGVKERDLAEVKKLEELTGTFQTLKVVRCSCNKISNRLTVEDYKHRPNNCIFLYESSRHPFHGVRNRWPTSSDL